MARRAGKAERQLLGCLFFLVGLPLMITSLVEYLGPEQVMDTGNAVFAVLALVAVVYGLARVLAWDARRRYLLRTYGDKRTVRALMRGQVWQGMTQAMLEDALGKPAAVDEQVSRDRLRFTWKYLPLGSNRYRLRVKLENGVVTGWQRQG